jgi:type II secretory pathway component GspD/PulD (secretin)
MKKIIFSLIAAGVAGWLVTASAQQPAPGDNNTNQPPVEQPGPPPDLGNGPGAGAPPGVAPMPGADNAAAPEENQTNEDNGSATITPSRSRPGAPEEIQPQFVPPAQAGTNADDLTLNFNRAPLDEVLLYLSDAAGFIIVQDTHVTGLVTVVGKHMTRDEAVDLLNAVLNKNGYAAIREGRTLTIVDKSDAKTRDIPVHTGNDPKEIPKNAEIVTQIIPIRFVEARQLVSDLSSFVSPQAIVVANEAGNSIVITDTQSNIRHIAEIIRAVDDSAEAETEIQVFPLKNASPTDVASEISSVFPNGTSGNTTQSPIRFGGGPGGIGGGGPGGFFRQMMANAAGGGGSSSQDRIKKETAVSAVADLRVSAVIVTAPKDLMQEIASMIEKLDVPSDRDQDVYVFKMNNADPLAAAQVLQSMFQNGSTSRSGSTSSGSTTSALQYRQQNNASTTGSSSSSSTGLGSMGGSRTGAGGGGF